MTVAASVAVLSTPEPAGPGMGGTATASRAGHCTDPIRLKGRTVAVDLATGEARPLYDTASQPEGVLLVPCGNRRESVCPACSTVYKRDARQLVKAGLVGGKGIPESIAAHPCVFATFTAPSFGPVHSRRLKRGTRIVLPCRPRRDHQHRRCPHGRDISCPIRHADDDPRLGRALCRDCYDYQAAVLFNAHAGDLWRRFTTYLPRHLARLAGITQTQLRAEVRVRYVKVAEYQARGVVHFHAVIRLDAAGEHYQPPHPRFAVTLLADAIRAAAAAVRVPIQHPGSPAIVLRFGSQIDCRTIRDGLADDLPGTGDKLSVQAVGNYIAKYATKAVDMPGVPDHPLRSERDIDTLRCHPHYKAMIRAAWELGGGSFIPDQLQGTAWELGNGRYVPARSRLCRSAHQFGWGGHFLTKSRRYSTTFGHLRRERSNHRKRLAHPHGEHDPWGRPLDDTVVLVLKDWSFQGRGHLTIAGEDMALASAARAREYASDAAA
jgi:hypothetical protein